MMPPGYLLRQQSGVDEVNGDAVSKPGILVRDVDETGETGNAGRLKLLMVKGFGGGGRVVMFVILNPDAIR
jgi:hypothetical protein